MYYQSKSTAFLLIFCCLNVLEATENLSNDEMDYLAGKVSVKDELLIEDEQLALAHIDMDIKDFEDLEKTINYLREQIRQHSDNHIVNQSELVKADNILRRVEDDEIHLSLLELKSLKKEILAMKHRISNTSINHINFIVEGAEQFLSKSLTDVTEIVRENVKWTSEEEKERIIDMVFHPKTNFSQPMIKKIYSSNATSNNQAKYPSKMSEGLKASLENAKIVIKKIKEEKQLRHPVQGIVNKTENVEGKKIETETIQKPLQTKFEEEKSNNIKATEHVKIDNKTIDAFNVAKDGSHKFIDKVFHRDSEKNVQISPLEIRDRYVDYIFMGMIFLGMLVILLILRPVKKMTRTRRTLMTNTSEIDHDLQGVQVEADTAWERWSPTSAKNHYKLK